MCWGGEREREAGESVGFFVVGGGGGGAMRQAGPSCGRFDFAWEVKAAIETRGRASYFNLPHFKSRGESMSDPLPLPSRPVEGKELGVGGGAKPSRAF